MKRIVEWSDDFIKHGLPINNPLFKKTYFKKRLGPLYKIESAASLSVSHQSLTDLKTTSLASIHSIHFSENKYKGNL